LLPWASFGLRDSLRRDGFEIARTSVEEFDLQTLE